MRRRVLVTGGVRAGKSFHAESLVLGEQTLQVLEPGPDTDLAAAISGAEGALVVDCLGRWLHGQLGDLDGWDALREEWEPVLLERVDAAAAALSAAEHTVVLVTNETGMGAPAEQRSARLHGELLAVVNQRLAVECDAVHLVVAGRVLSL